MCKLSVHPVKLNIITTFSNSKTDLRDICNGNKLDLINFIRCATAHEHFVNSHIISWNVRHRWGKKSVDRFMSKEISRASSFGACVNFSRDFRRNENGKFSGIFAGLSQLTRKCVNDQLNWTNIHHSNRSVYFFSVYFSLWTQHNGEEFARSFETHSKVCIWIWKMLSIPR